MVATVAARKSRLHNALEGFALTAILQSFPAVTSAALLLNLCGVVGHSGVAYFVSFTSLANALFVVTVGPKWPFFKAVYEPKFFDGSLSLSDKITEWCIRPATSRQLVMTVLMLSVMTVVTTVSAG